MEKLLKEWYGCLKVHPNSKYTKEVQNVPKRNNNIFRKNVHKRYFSRKSQQSSLQPTGMHTLGRKLFPIHIKRNRSV